MINIFFMKGTFHHNKYGVHHLTAVVPDPQCVQWVTFFKSQAPKDYFLKK